jgi:peptide/nickel transport system ATP-binding protein
MITHDLGVVAEVCDEVAVIYAGEIIENGTLEEIYDHPIHPYTQGLFGAIPSLDNDVERLNAIPGMPANPTDLPKGCHFSPRCTCATGECLTSKVPLLEIRPNHFCRCYKTLSQEVSDGTVN